MSLPSIGFNSPVVGQSVPNILQLIEQNLGGIGLGEITKIQLRFGIS
jgi:hypothetical protein